MLDTDREHEGTTATILCHLARTITIALHEGHQSCRGQSRVIDRRSLGTDMTEVMTHTSTTLHQLYLLFVNAQHTAIRVSIAIESDDKTVTQ